MSVQSRAAALEHLEREPFDLLVVGGGIVGSRVALDAARCGLRVALVDAGDFGGATSSASSKLVHGGFRYLSFGNLSLVREAQRERRHLIERIAPHLIRRLPLVLGIDGDSPHGPAAIGFGLRLYAALCGFAEPVGRVVDAARAAELVPALAADRLSACAVLEEAQTNDARLTLATVAAAARAGAVVANYVRVLDLGGGAGGVSGAAALALPEGRPLRVRARAVVNASGPWLDAVRRLEDPAAAPLVRLSKGVHVMLPLPEGWRAGAAVLLPDKRNVYAIPFEGSLLLGATDTLFEGDPATVAPTAGDVAYLLREAGRILDPAVLRREHVRFAFAGLRVLPPGGGETQRARREAIFAVGPREMVSVGGGKLTTHRAIAWEVLRLLPAEVRPRRRPPLERLVPADGAPAAEEALEPRTLAYLRRTYGNAAAILRTAAADPQGLAPIVAGAPDVWAQVDHAVDHEWAVTVDDVTRRRTTLSLRGLDTPRVRAAIAARMRGLGAAANGDGAGRLRRRDAPAHVQPTRT